ncbi:hypothetical protein CSOJ01_10910 [Colletotrichum sojae]|uniref:Uncharacterized protein n=1 Tax=Colletotrichum sojae TaxID=2175907 RepID=A0A8H6IZM5_9PEZI|nr:hypothetical protein CSOJ01_10910 [Colletotrichum sojae]
MYTTPTATPYTGICMVPTGGLYLPRPSTLQNTLNHKSLPPSPPHRSSHHSARQNPFAADDRYLRSHNGQHQKFRGPQALEAIITSDTCAKLWSYNGDDSGATRLWLLEASSFVLLMNPGFRQRKAEDCHRHYRAPFSMKDHPTGAMCIAGLKLVIFLGFAKSS